MIADVGPDPAYFAGRPVRVRADGPAVVEIVRRPSRVVRTFNRRERRIDLRWNGRVRGRPAREGRYAVRVGAFAFGRTPS